ncbi:MAG: SecDF P1 head subdomain-containing protein [Caulobacteraceae bacterium]
MFKSSMLLGAMLACAIASGAAAAPSCPNAGWVVVERKASAETRPVKDRPNHRIFVRRAQITTTADLTEIKLDGDAYDTLVQMKFTPEAAKRLHDATTDKSGLRIAFVTDDRVISAVTWTGPYGMDAEYGAQISLGRASSEVRPLVEAIQKCVGAGAK